jgi:hypothetical protein
MSTPQPAATVSTTSDLNLEPNHDVARWNETRWNGCWNADEGVGLYLHAGRYRADLDMWWVQVVAYLPDRQLCVDRFFGRNTSTAGVRVGGLDVAMTENGWTASFAGVGQLTSVDALARAAQGSSAPVGSMSFEVSAQGCAPVWDMYAGRGDRLDFAGDTHVQQGSTTAGMLHISGTDYDLNGIGFKDHSSGVRDFSDWTGHQLFLIVSPAFTCHVIAVRSSDGEPPRATGALFRDGQQFGITRFELPPLADSAGGPVHGDGLIETTSGERLRFSTELVHALPMTITLDNDNINGIDWQLDGDPLVVIEGKGRLTLADGTVAHCFHERSARRSHVKLPK